MTEVTGCFRGTKLTVHRRSSLSQRQALIGMSPSRAVELMSFKLISEGGSRILSSHPTHCSHPPSSIFLKHQFPVTYQVQKVQVNALTWAFLLSPSSRTLPHRLPGLPASHETVCSGLSFIRLPFVYHSSHTKPSQVVFLSGILNVIFSSCNKSAL